MPLALNISATVVPPPTGTYPTDSTIVTPDDTVTNFAKNAAILSVQSGDWSDAATWDLARVPTAGDIVGIKTTHVVTYDVVSTAAVLAVGIAGTLSFRRDINTKLTVQSLLVYGPPTLGAGVYGELDISTAADPTQPSVTTEFVWTDAALIDPNGGVVVNKEYSNGLLVWGKIRSHGAIKTDFVECTANLTAGQTTINFQSPVTGWRSGDRVLIPDTRVWQSFGAPVIDSNDFDNIEVKAVAVISDPATSMTVPALSFAHPRAVDKDGNQDFAPEVTNLTRNVIFRSANPNGVHGHSIYFDRADVDVRYSRYDSMGRTKNGNSLTNGVPNTTTNQKGRYPVHFHHVFGPGDGSQGSGGVGYDSSVDPLEFKPGDAANTRSANGPVLRFIGNVIEDQTTVSPDAKWPITLHETSDVLIKSNVVYKGDGSLIMFEDGTEVYNVLHRNFILKTRTGTGDRGDASYSDGFPGREGNGFSCPNAHSWYRDNRVYNIGAHLSFPSNTTAYHFYGGQNTHNGNSGGTQQDNHDFIVIGSWAGADPDDNGERRYTYPTLEFSDNRVCNCENGLTYWFLGCHYSSRGPEEIATTTILRFNVWNSRVATFNYPTANLYYSGGKWRQCHVGMSETDYMQRNLILDGVDIQLCEAGLGTTEKVGASGDANYGTEGTTKFRNLILANTVNWFNKTPAAVSGAAGLVARIHEFTNCFFYHPTGWTQDVQLLFLSDPINPGHTNWVLSDKTYFYQINGNSADNIRLYWTQQAGGFVTPQTDAVHDDIGSPESGKTNTYNLANHGVCVAGSIWPGTTTRTGFDGYVEVL